MSDSAKRPVSIELDPQDWQYVLCQLDYNILDGVRIAAEIRRQLPPEFPTGLGAVIRARRTGEASEQLYVLSARTTNEAFHHLWRDARQHGGWIHSNHLELIEILSPGVEV